MGHIARLYYKYAGKLPNTENIPHLDSYPYAIAYTHAQIHVTRVLIIQL